MYSAYQGTTIICPQCNRQYTGKTEKATFKLLKMHSLMTHNKTKLIHVSLTTELKSKSIKRSQNRYFKPLTHEEEINISQQQANLMNNTNNNITQ